MNINIDVCIPYAPDFALGKECNRILERSSGWVLLIDHDVFFLNPNWYLICQNAIEKVGKDAGWITCYTNRIGCLDQLLTVKDTDDLSYHIRIASERYRKNKGRIEDITEKARPLSGFFILTNKRVWELTGGFSEKYLGMDNDYHAAVKAGGFKIYRMEDLYCYHAYKRWWKTGKFEELARKGV